METCATDVMLKLVDKSINSIDESMTRVPKYEASAIISTLPGDFIHDAVKGANDYSYATDGLVLDVDEATVTRALSHLDIAQTITSETAGKF